MAKIKWRAGALVPCMWLALLCSTVTSAHAEEPLLSGKGAYGDWTQDAPGVRRLITANDLYDPMLTPSASNSPKIVSIPDDAELKVPPGFKVSMLVGGLKEPRQMKVAPGGDIFVSESGNLSIRAIRINADGTVSNEVFADNLPERPYGIAFYPPQEPIYIYVATQEHILRYPYHAGDMKARSSPEIIVSDLAKGGHWTRDILFSEDGSKMYVAVGSGSNHAEFGMDFEKWRANVLEYNPDGTGKRVYADGLRNPVTLAFNPVTHDLWATVNERDTMGDNLPPDYATRVVPGGFYGWPWYYIGAHQDPEYKGQHPELKDKIQMPDVLVQPHSAPLGCAFYTGSQFPPEYQGDMFIALHGSWNREKRTGYKLVLARFKDGKATGEYDDFMTGFVTRDGNVWGRPVGVAMAQDGSLLMSDDASGVIWKIAYAGKNLPAPATQPSPRTSPSAR